MDFLYNNFFPTSFLLSESDYGDTLVRWLSVVFWSRLHWKQPFSVGVHQCNCSLRGLSLSHKPNCYQHFIFFQPLFFFPHKPDCYLHLHLRWADNPYVSGTVHTKDTAPGLIMGAGKSTTLFCKT